MWKRVPIGHGKLVGWIDKKGATYVFFKRGIFYLQQNRWLEEI